MPGARRGRPDDDRISGRDLWTLEGTRALIRKLQADPGLAEEFRKEAIESVKSGAAGRGVISPEFIKQDVNREEKMQEIKTEDTQKQPNMPEDSGKDFDAYQKFTTTVALYPPEVGIQYTTSGLCGETAEVAGKVQSIVAKNLVLLDGSTEETTKNLKILNDLLKLIAKQGEDAEKFKKAVRKGSKRLPELNKITEEEKLSIAYEIGDVLWYCAQLSKSLGLSLATVAKMNVEKLSSRKTRNVIQGEGDSR